MSEIHDNSQDDHDNEWPKRFAKPAPSESAPDGREWPSEEQIQDEAMSRYGADPVRGAFCAGARWVLAAAPAGTAPQMREALEAAYEYNRFMDPAIVRKIGAALGLSNEKDKP